MARRHFRPGCGDEGDENGGLGRARMLLQDLAQKAIQRNDKELYMICGVDYLSSDVACSAIGRATVALAFAPYA